MGKLDSFISLLNAEVANGSIYVWGAQGQTGSQITESWIRSRETSTENANRAINHWNAKKQAGFGNTLKAFDCSGLGVWALQQLGIISGDMNANSLMGKCSSLSKNQIKKGDWVFRKNSSGTATHIGYVVDDSKNVVEAKGRDDGVVRRGIDANGSSYWNGFGRPSYFATEITTGSGTDYGSYQDSGGMSTGASGQGYSSEGSGVPESAISNGGYSSEVASSMSQMNGGIPMYAAVRVAFESGFSLSPVPPQYLVDFTSSVGEVYESATGMAHMVSSGNIVNMTFIDETALEIEYQIMRNGRWMYYSFGYDGTMLWSPTYHLMITEYTLDFRPAGVTLTISGETDMADVRGASLYDGGSGYYTVPTTTSSSGYADNTAQMSTPSYGDATDTSAVSSFIGLHDKAAPVEAVEAANAAAAEFGVPVGILLGTASCESNFRIDAQSSSSSAAGPMQILDRTYKDIVNRTLGEDFDRYSWESMRAAASYYKDAYNAALKRGRTGDDAWRDAVLGYRWGAGSSQAKNLNDTSGRVSDIEKQMRANGIWYTTMSVDSTPTSGGGSTETESPITTSVETGVPNSSTPFNSGTGSCCGTGSAYACAAQANNVGSQYDDSYEWKYEAYPNDRTAKDADAIRSIYPDYVGDGRISDIIAQVCYDNNWKIGRIDKTEGPKEGDVFYTQGINPIMMMGNVLAPLAVSESTGVGPYTVFAEADGLHFTTSVAPSAMPTTSSGVGGNSGGASSISSTGYGGRVYDFGGSGQSTTVLSFSTSFNGETYLGGSDEIGAASVDSISNELITFVAGNNTTPKKLLMSDYGVPGKAYTRYAGASSLTPSQLQTYANAMYAKAQANEVTATLTVIGDPTIRMVGSDSGVEYVTVLIRNKDGILHHLSRKYRMTAVTHSISGGTYTTEMELASTGMPFSEGQELLGNNPFSANAYTGDYENQGLNGEYDSTSGESANRGLSEYTDIDGASAEGNALIQAARQYIGRSYESMDCSDLVEAAAKAAGISGYSGTAANMYATQKKNGNVYAYTGTENIPPGSVLYWASSNKAGCCTSGRCGNSKSSPGSCERSGGIHHVGIYVQGDTIIDSIGSRNGVTEGSLWGENGSTWNIVGFSPP